MGLGYPMLRLMADENDKGASFESMATLGKQVAYIRPAELKKLSQDLKKPPVTAEFGQVGEHLFKHFLHSKNITSFDVSDFENATVIHDMNKPIDSKYYNKFDVIYDGGTLEHIFNFPVAIENVMAMLKVGGHFFSCFGANNYCGHGLYQFSFELMYQIFKPSNGFVVKEMLAMEHPYAGAELSNKYKVYEVKNPEDVCQRIICINSKPILGHLVTQKISDIEPFSFWVQQSDYQARWSDFNNPGDVPLIEQNVRRTQNFRQKIGRLLPIGLRQELYGLIGRMCRNTLRNKKFFKKIKK